MINKPIFFPMGWLLIPLILILSACSGMPRLDRESSSEAAPVVDLDTSTQGVDRADGAVIQPGDSESDKSVSSNRATLGLLAQADQLQRKGELEASAAVLERALRIEPRNARLWSRLAGLRLAQGKSQLAANLAAKSNSLAGADSQLVEKNNEIIMDARLGR